MSNPPGHEAALLADGCPTLTAGIVSAHLVARFFPDDDHSIIDVAMDFISAQDSVCHPLVTQAWVLFSVLQGLATAALGQDRRKPENTIMKAILQSTLEPLPVMSGSNTAALTYDRAMATASSARICRSTTPVAPPLPTPICSAHGLATNIRLS